MTINNVAGIIGTLTHAVGQAEETHQTTRRPYLASDGSIVNITPRNVGQSCISHQRTRILGSVQSAIMKRNILYYSTISTTEQSNNSMVTTCLANQSRDAHFVAIETTREKGRLVSDDMPDRCPEHGINIGVLV